MERILLRDGWLAVRKGKHKFYEKTLSDGRVLRTMLSHSSGEVPAIVLRKICKQIEKTIEELNQLR
jgi:predicted RNA binding protein YcfA (HicA-like mRNA interferase family)